MTKTSLCLITAAAAALVACSPIERSRDLANPKVPAATLAEQVCSNCHGQGGHAVSPNFPNLAGQTAPYLAAQLSQFKRHSRQDPAGYEYMWGLSRSLSDGQIQGLADYYAEQQPQAQPLEGDASRLQAGKLVFDNGVPGKNIPACAACHGAQAQGQAAMPRLAGQHADYLIKQLMVFQRSDDRPEGSIMKTVAHDLTPENILDVTSYLQSLPASKDVAAAVDSSHVPATK